MIEIVIFDFEVFKHDTLLGAKIISPDNTVAVWQSWDLDEIRRFFAQHSRSMWIGHNNTHYDNFILQGIVNGFTQEQVKALNDDIIVHSKKMWLNMPLISYDLMMNRWVALKLVEGFVGKNISESPIDFNLDRPLTEEEKRKTEKYNIDDLDQTEDNLQFLKGELMLRLNIISEFKLNPIQAMSYTGTRLAEEVLKAKKVPDIDTWVRLPEMKPNLQIANEDVKAFFLNRDYATGKKLKVNFGGAEHVLAAGGIHGALRKYHTKEAILFDVSGYYNLLMILLDLLPRSIPDESKQLYEQMYHEQLRLKTEDPERRAVYKTILLSVFGAMNNKHCRFYDPYNGDLVRIYGQMYIVDLLEKLEPYAKVVQSNTDGVIVEPLEGVPYSKLEEIAKEWETRTGFSLPLEKIYDVYQRDVNNYMYRDKDFNIITRGEIVTHYGKIDYPFWKDSYNSKEPLIIPEAIVNYFMHGITPEETIEKNKDNLRLFQYLTKKLSFDWVEYEETDLVTGDIEVEHIQNINRAFASNSKTTRGMIYKNKHHGKVRRSRISNLPPSVFVWNTEILSDKAIEQIQQKIDYQYYVIRAYERILEFLE